MQSRARCTGAAPRRPCWHFWWCWSHSWCRTDEIWNCSRSSFIPERLMMKQESKRTKDKASFHSYSVISYSDLSYFCSWIKQKIAVLYFRFINLMSGWQHKACWHFPNSITTSSQTPELPGCHRWSSVSARSTPEEPQVASIVFDFQQKQQQKARLTETGYRSEEQGAGIWGLQTNLKKHFIQPQISFELFLRTRENKREKASKRNDGADK